MLCTNTHNLAVKWFKLDMYFVIKSNKFNSMGTTYSNTLAVA